MDFIAIFKNQLSGHLKQVNELLLELENKPDDSELIQPLMRLFHTIKGAARAVQFDEIRDIAHTLEEIYHDLMDGKAEPQPGLPSLTRCAAQFIAEVLEAKLNKEEYSAHETFPSLVENYLAGEQPDCLDSAGQNQDLAEAEQRKTEDAAPVEEIKIEQEKAPPVSPGGGFDFVAIFKNQLSGHIKEVTKLSLELEKDGQEPALYESMMRQFHTIKGAARAIKFEEIKDIAHKIEDIYHTLMNGDTTPRPQLIDLTLHAVDLIEECLDARLQERESDSHLGFASLVDAYLAGDTIQIPRSAILAPEGDSGESEGDPGSSHEAGKSSEYKIVSRRNGDRRCSAPQFDDFEGFTENLLTTSGELTVAVGSMEEQRRIMRSVANDLASMDRLLTRTTSDNTADAAIQTPVQKILKEQLRALEMLDTIESRFSLLGDELDSQVTKARLVPLEAVFSTYPRLVRDLSQELGKKCRLSLRGQETRIDRGILEAVRVPLLHLLRNGLDHGIEPPEQRKKLGKPQEGNLRIEVIQLGAQIRISISDDGAGIDMASLRTKVLARNDTTAEMWEAMTSHEQEQFLFLPGLSTADNVTETSGRGVGLDVVKTEVETVGGHISCQNRPGQGSTFILELPLTLSMTKCLLVKGGMHPYFGEQHFAFPVGDVGEVRRLAKQDLRSIDGQEAVRIVGETIPVHNFAHLMKLSPLHKELTHKHLILADSGHGRIGLLVEEVLDEQHIVRRRFDERVGKVRDVEGLTLLRDGSVALIVDISDVLLSVSSLKGTDRIDDEASALDEKDQDRTSGEHILVVEDSQTVREVERHFLESAGYQVTTAVDGVDGLNKFKEANFALIISDIDMPRMNGLDMIRELRTEPAGQELPMIVVSYKDREKDHRQASAAGANMFVTKADFDSTDMLARIESLLERRDA